MAGPERDEREYHASGTPIGTDAPVALAQARAQRMVACPKGGGQSPQGRSPTPVHRRPDCLTPRWFAHMLPVTEGSPASGG